MKSIKILRGAIALVACTITFQAAAIQPMPLYVVADDYIHPHLIVEHEEALLDFKQKVDQYGYQQSWRFYQFDDGRHVAFNAQQSPDFHAQSDNDWAAVADKFDPEFLASNSAVYRETIAKQHFYQVTYRADLSIEPEKNTEKPLSHLVFVEIQMRRDTSIRESFKTWLEQQKKFEDKFHFSTYSKSYGSNMPTLYLVFHTNSFINFYQKLESRGVFDPVQLFPRKVKAGIAEYKISLAKYIPEISY